MGFLQAPDRVEIGVVATSMGIVTHGGTTYQKGRVWILDDHRLILCVPGPNRTGVTRIELGVVAISNWKSRSKQLSVTFENGSTLGVNAKGCGCGAGAVGNAGPVAEPHHISRVRAPEWHTIEPGA